jgi:hypothetical protein
MTATAVHDCVLAPDAYWALRDDEGYHDYLSSAVEPPTKSVLHQKTEEDGCVTRVASLTPLQNPIPYAMRSMLKCRDGFTFKITEKWRRDRCDAEHPMSFVTTPPVFADRISVEGTQWVTAHETGCRLHFELVVRCRVNGVGGLMSRAISDGSLASYKQLPTLALEYTTLRRAATEASEAFERASRMTQRTTDDDAPPLDDAPPCANAESVSAAADAEAAASAASAALEAAAALEEGRRIRARRRWCAAPLIMSDVPRLGRAGGPCARAARLLPKCCQCAAVVLPVCCCQCAAMVPLCHCAARRVPMVPWCCHGAANVPVCPPGLPWCHCAHPDGQRLFACKDCSPPSANYAPACADVDPHCVPCA